MRLAAVELVDEANGAGLLDRQWDCIFTTSLLGAADLRSLLPPTLRSTPLVVYLHENQAAYPQGPSVPELARRDSQFALTNLTSILAADRVIWNSAWNRDSFIRGIDDILRHSPDTTLRPAMEQRVLNRSEVIWPPVEMPPWGIVRHERQDGAPIRVLWPHRWEHDKGPDELLAIAERESERLNLRWTILGERYRKVPGAFAAFEQRLAHRIDHFGFLPSREAYWAAVHNCDWVLSTATHEFFGVSVVEALLAGCLPWLPSRLSYPEILPESAHGLSPDRGEPSEEWCHALRSEIQSHLEPARAFNAVARIDASLQQCTRETCQ